MHIYGKPFYFKEDCLDSYVSGHNNFSPHPLRHGSISVVVWKFSNS